MEPLCEVITHRNPQVPPTLNPVPSAQLICAFNKHQVIFGTRPWSALGFRLDVVDEAPQQWKDLDHSLAERINFRSTGFAIDKVRPTCAVIRKGTGLSNRSDRTKPEPICSLGVELAESICRSP